MAWPSSKPNTTTTDSAGDLISDSRSDINLAISNVNDITDFIDTSSIANGDILVYNSSSGTLVRDTNNVVSDVANTFSKAQAFGLTTLTDAATISWDLSANQVAQVELGGNRTLGAPTNQVAGATYILIVSQDSVGSQTLAYHATYKFPGGTDPTLTTTASSKDVLAFVSDGTSMYGNILLDVK
jgi:hypothetical protein